ncbi:HDOD domain-containing protein [uncultured Desulfuromusa sp.]|uniref:HDOD domain-containing protein n=1 Tax=uncultured Desulfuromusa sp. TaxID=219183 RepID=UPI002AA7BCF4|nr:HDOD domain-containing protein [uncultured Desulfuromusa sp.]
MALIYIDDLTVGMVLAEDLFTPKGRFVLAAGATLQQDHLKILKSWGVIEASIDESTMGEGYNDNQELLAQFIDRAHAYLGPRFMLNNMEEEPVATLYRHAVHYFSLQFQKGFDPEILSEQLPEASGEGQIPLKIPHLLKDDVDIVSLPTVYSHIVDLLDRPDSSSQQIAKAISKDASLTIRLLRLVNSPFYGFSGKIDSVSRAVSLLGTNELSTLTLGILVVRQFQNLPASLLNMDSFWRHSIRCGLFSKVLAGYLGEKEVEKYFIGGLLHDVGRLVLLGKMPALYSDTVARARQGHLQMYRAEQDSLNTDHSIVGKLLAEKWRLPPALIRMIGSHHSPRLARYSIEACICHIADVFAHACGHEAMLVNEIPELQRSAWDEIGLQEELIAPTIQQVNAEFKDVVHVFFGHTD